jgi:potassium channel subfamily K
MIVQVRDVKALRKDDANMIAIWRGEEEKTARDQKSNKGPRTEHDAEQLDMLSRVRRYRNTFAEILVVGSILQKLEGEELNRFERWRMVDEAELNAERKEEAEDIKAVAEERYDGITGMVFRRHARNREKEFTRMMSIREKGGKRDPER